MEYCFNCLEEMLPHFDNDLNGEANVKCAKCRAEESHDFDVEPDVEFDRAGRLVEPDVLDSMRKPRCPEDLLPETRLIHREIEADGKFVQETCLFKSEGSFYLTQTSNYVGEPDRVRKIFLTAKQLKMFGEKFLECQRAPESPSH